MGTAVLQPLALAVSGGGEIGDRERDLLGEVSGRFDVVGVVSGSVLSGIDANGGDIAVAVAPRDPAGIAVLALNGDTLSINAGT